MNLYGRASWFRSNIWNSLLRLRICKIHQTIRSKYGEGEGRGEGAFNCTANMQYNSEIVDTRGSKSTGSWNTSLNKPHFVAKLYNDLMKTSDIAS